MAKKTAEVKPETTFSITTFRQYEATIEGMSALLMNRILPEMFKSKAENSKKAKEDPAEVDRKTWREKTYHDDDGELYIPAVNIKKCLCDGAKDWGGKFQGKTGYTNFIIRSVSITNDIMLGIHKDEEDKNKLDPFATVVNGNPSNWKGSSKVIRTRPRISKWGGTFGLVVADDRLTEDILRVIIGEAGITGIGDFRKLGGYGKFRLVSLKKVS